MVKIPDFNAANEVLKKYIPKSVGSAYSLDRMFDLMTALGNPQNKLKVIHVAGTSGKTSTCYYVSSLLSNSGYKVGLTVSPHIDQVNERVQINQVPLPETEYCKNLEEFLNLVDDLDISPTYFELLVGFAYWYFEKENVDYAVVEVGLGGLLDGTNVINRSDKVCILTDIGLDHTAILGNTLPEIAFQKAGIVQPGNQVYVNRQTDEIIDVFTQQCNRVGAELLILELEDSSKEDSSLGLVGFQLRNFNLARQAVEATIARDYGKQLDAEAIVLASKSYIPARMEIADFNGRSIILDGSHNSQKISALVSAIKQKYPVQKMRLLISFGIAKEESITGSLELLRSISDSVVLTSFSLAQDENRRSIDLSLLADYCKHAGFSSIELEAAPARAFDLLVDKPADLYLVTGSLYLLKYIRPRLKLLNVA